jgi:putative heme-binding domain-containing protein
MHLAVNSFFVVAVCFSFCTVHCIAEDLGLRAPPGFEVTLFAGDELAHNIYSMTLDSQGRVVVSGPEYIKILHDDDHNGIADKATLLTNKPASGAHGLLCDGTDFFFTGDDGIWKCSDANNDFQADAPPALWYGPLTHREHGANGIVRGPDGDIYVICGNDAGVTAKIVSQSTSPIKEPNCGTVLRFSRTGQQRSILAHGFRNPYDLCFHPAGSIFTVDADGERDHRLPWYAPTRLFDVGVGAHHGWVNNGWVWSWNRPASYFDNVARCAEIDRGSPTGMWCYRHAQFPPKYRDGIFSACWTFGRVYFFPLQAHESTYSTTPEVFLETTGQVGFAPVDLEVAPNGDMYVAIGGRNTRGSVFRVRYTGDALISPHFVHDKLEEMLLMPEPLTAWSRTQWLPLAQATPPQDLIAAAGNANYALAARVRAIEILAELYRQPEQADCEKLAALNSPQVVARVAWYLSRLDLSNTSWNYELLAKLTHVADPIVQRAAWESLLSLPLCDKKINANWSIDNTTDRRLLFAKIAAVNAGYTSESREFQAFTNDKSLSGIWLQLMQQKPNVWESISEQLQTTPVSAPEFLYLLRALVVSLGDISTDPNQKNTLAGYSFRHGEVLEKISPDKLRSILNMLVEVFPTNQPEVNREIARIMAMFEQEHAMFVDKTSELLTNESSPLDDLHYLFCLSRIPGERSAVARDHIANALAGLDSKMKMLKWQPSRNWPDRVSDLIAKLTQYDSGLPAKLLAADKFAASSQAFMALRFPTAEKIAAARKLLTALQKTDDNWNSEMVQLVAALPEAESQIALQQVATEPVWKEAAMVMLAKQPRIENRTLFVECLSSPQANMVEIAANALRTLELQLTAPELAAAIASLRQACSHAALKGTRQALQKLIEQQATTAFEIRDRADALLQSYEPCFAWFKEHYPTESLNLEKSSVYNAVDWQARFDKLDWMLGDATIGQKVFEKLSCARCHAGTSPLGPELKGAAGRFSRSDLFAAILEPNREVAPPYLTSVMETGSGKIYLGTIVYESPDSTILLTGPETTVRVAGEEIVALVKSKQSLMPAGLLNTATDAELIHLYAYLQSLRK